MPGRRRFSGDHLKEGRTIAFQFLGPHAPDPRHVIQRHGPGLGHLDQRPIIEDDVGRHAGRFSKRSPLGLQGRQKRRVLLRDQRLGRRSPRSVFNRIAPERDFSLTA